MALCGGEVSSTELQGSALGLALFINNLDVQVNSTVITFADDTKLGGVTNTSEDKGLT